MTDRKKNAQPIALDAATRAQAVAAIREFVAAEWDEPIGDLKASLLLDHLLAEIGPAVYNLALSDARAYLDERVSDLAAVLHREEFPGSVRRKRD